GNWAEGLKRAAEAVGWDEPLPAHRGRGVAIGIKSPRPGTTSQAIVRLHHDGSASVLAGTTDMGQGSRTVFSQIAAQSLEIPLEKVVVVSGDTGIAPFDAITASSRSTVCMGNAIVAACEQVKRKIAAIAGELHGVLEQGVTVADGRAHLLGRSLTYSELIQAYYGPGEGEVIGVGEYRQEPDPNHPLGGRALFWEVIFFAAEVEVDEQTGQYEITKLVTVGDIGKAINPAHVEGQDEGGALMGVGHTMMEQLLYDECGR
ncbi:unnamed protein product, partial [marine sediment metagenome]